MFAYIVACLISGIIIGLFLVNKPLYATGFYVFSRVAAQPLLATEMHLYIPTTGVLGITFVLANIFYIFAKRKKNIILPLNASFIPLIALLLWSLITLLLSENITVSVGAFLRITAWIFIYYILLIKVNNKKNCLYILRIVVFAALTAAIYGGYQYLNGMIYYKPEARGLYVTSFFPTANSYGIFLSLSIFASITYYLLCDNIFVKRGLSVAILMFLISLIFTMHRASWLTVFVFFLLLAIKNVKKKKIFLYFVVFFMFCCLFQDVILQRLFAFQYRQQGISSLESRALTWKAMIDEIKQQPIKCISTGFGVGVATSDRISTGLVPHNDFLRIFFELGLLGFVSYILFLTSLLWRNIARFIKYKKLLFAVSSYAAIYFIVISFLQNNFYDVRNMSIFMVILSVSHCCSRYKIFAQ